MFGLQQEIYFKILFHPIIKLLNSVQILTLIQDSFIILGPEALLVIKHCIKCDYMTCPRIVNTMLGYKFYLIQR